MSAVHSMEELLKGYGGEAAAYEAGGPVVVLHRDLEARLRQDAGAVGEPIVGEPAVGFGERCIRGVSRAAGPALLLAGYGAIGWGVYTLLF